MKSSSSLLLSGVVVISFVVASTCFALAQVAKPRNGTAAVIEMKDVPLSVAVRQLARQMELNYILDPAVQGSLDPLVTICRENITAEQALTALLAEHRLTITPNPVTSIARIRPADQPVRPSAAKGVIGSNDAIRLIEMDDAPVIQVITNLAAQARLKILLHPKVATRLDPWSPNSPLPRSSRRLTVRWKDVTAGQALLAVLDNYDLALAEGADGAAWQVTERPEIRSEPDRAANGSQPLHTETNRTSSADGSGR